MPGVYSVVQYPPCLWRLSLPQRSLTTTSLFTADSLKSQARSSWTSPFSRGQVPFAVREDDRRLVARHHVLELRDHVLGDVAGLVGEPERVVPLVEGIVEAHPQALGAHRLRQFPEKVALRANLDGVPRAAPCGRRLAARPQGEPFVVLRCRHHVLRARSAEDLGPVIRVEELGRELRGEVAVVELRAVLPAVVVPGARLDRARLAAFAAGERIPVPLCVRELAGQNRGV